MKMSRGSRLVSMDKILVHGGRKLNGTVRIS